VGGDGAVREGLERTERELEEGQRRLRDRDFQIAAVLRGLEDTEQATASEVAPLLSAEGLRAKLEAIMEENRKDLAQQRERLLEDHRRELHMVLFGRYALTGRSLEEREEAIRAQQAAAHDKLARSLRDEADAAVTRTRGQAEYAEQEVRRLRATLSPLRRQREESIEQLCKAHELLQSERAERGDPSGRIAELERRLAEAQAKRRQLERRHGNLELHLRAQIRSLQSELQARQEELRQRGAALEHQDEEFAEVSVQLADLHGVFDDMNRQLLTECDRIKELEASVSQCAQKVKELEQLHKMLDDSHGTLGQLRDALEVERAEHLRSAGLLQQEQHRTQLLLDVLRNIKDKLQGLSPALLAKSLEPGADLKALIASATGGSQEPPSALRRGDALAREPGIPKGAVAMPRAATGGRRTWSAPASDGEASSTALPDTGRSWAARREVGEARTAEARSTPSRSSSSPRGAWVAARS